MKNVGIKILIIILILLVIVSGILFVMKFMEDKNLQGKIQTGDNEEQNNGTKVVEIKEPTTFKGTDRPIAVMIDKIGRAHV